MDNEMNLMLANHPERIAAQKALDDVVHHITTDIKADGNAMYYLTVMPPLLKKLEAAYDSLIVVESKIIAELENHHGNDHD